MRFKTYRLFSFIFISIFVFIFSGCESRKQDIKEESKNTITVNKSEKSSKEEMTLEEKNKILNNYYEYFYTRSTPLIYRGYQEYGHNIIFESEANLKEGKKYYYKGTMADGMGEDKFRGERRFNASYEVNCNGIIEKVVNDDYFSERRNSLNSIIENFIVVKGKIEIGNSWEQIVAFKEKQYKAKTEIIEVADDMFTTETIINGIHGFNKNVYMETRTYKKSFGLIKFSATAYYENGVIPENDLGISYSMNMN